MKLIIPKPNVPNRTIFIYEIIDKNIKIRFGKFHPIINNNILFNNTRCYTHIGISVEGFKNNSGMSFVDFFRFKSRNNKIKIKKTKIIYKSINGSIHKYEKLNPKISKILKKILIPKLPYLKEFHHKMKYLKMKF